MIPSDLVLKAGTLIGYNNNIVIATADMNIGQNEQVNKTQVPGLQPKMKDHVNEIAEASSKSSGIISPVYLSVGISLLVLLMFYGMTSE